MQALCLINRQQIAVDHFRTGSIEAITFDKARHSGLAPADHASLIKLEGRGCRRRKGPHTGLDLFGKATPRRCENGRFFLTIRKRRLENKSVQHAHFLTFNQNRTVRLYRSHQILLFLQSST